MGTVIIVSDHPDERHVFAEALEGAGLRVLAFSDPETALETVASHAPAAVITRLGEADSDFDGIDMIRRIRAMATSIHVVVIASVWETHRREEAVRTGCDEYLLMPVSVTELAERIAALSVGRCRA